MYNIYITLDKLCINLFCPSPVFSLPIVSFDVVSFDILEVMSEVILQSGHYAAVFVYKLSSSGLRCEPVHHG